MTMEQQPVPETAIVAPATPALDFKQAIPKTFSQKVAWICLEIAAPLLWLYVIVKLFIFDIDRYVIAHIASQYIWLLNFKLFIALGIVAICWLTFGNANTLVWFLYILFYPLILIFWKIPKFIFKQKSWTLAFAALNSLISFGRSFKFNFILSALFLGFLAVSVAFSNRYLLWGSVCGLLLLTIINFVRKFWTALKPSGIFKFHAALFKWARNKGTPNFFALDETLRAIPVLSLDQQQLQKRTEKLQMAVLFNRVCLFSARKLQDYQNSGWQFVPSVFTILGLILFTAISFTGINMALFKLDPSLYQYTQIPTLFTFFYYSFSNLIFHEIPQLSAVTPLSESILMFQEFCSFTLTVIFVVLIISVRGERYSAELEKVIEEIAKEGTSMEGFIKEEYQIDNIAAALIELERVKAGMLSFLYWFAKDL